MLSLLVHSLGKLIGRVSICSGLLSDVEFGDNERVTNEPVVHIYQTPGRELVLGDPFHEVLTLTELIKLRRTLHDCLEHAYMLPSVVLWVTEQILVVFVPQVNLVPSFKSHVSSISDLMGFCMQFFVSDWVSKVFWLRDVFRNV